jgi:NADH dehydrogenase FAD-containing subunit
MDAQKKVVIIGGGFAGATAAKLLERTHDVTLIDAKDFFEFTPGILRAIIQPKILPKLQAKHTDYLKRARVFVGAASKITPKDVIIGKQSYPYDFLIVSAGSDYSLPIKERNVMRADRGAHILEANARLRKAKSVLIVGAGLVGVELAAELAVHGKTKVTLVSSGPTLLERNEPKSQRYAEKFLRAHGVTLLFRELVHAKGKGFITDSKKKLKADMAFFCTGLIPNSSVLPKSVDDHKRVRVNEFLQVEGMKNVFAPGDLNNVVVEKTAQNAEIQARLAVDNIKRLEHRRPLVAYRPRKTPLVISLGPRDGIFETRSFVITGFIPALLKRVIEFREMRKF